MNYEIVWAVGAAALFIASFAAVGGSIIARAGGELEVASVRSLPLAIATGFAVYSFAAYALIAAFGPPRPFVVIVLVAAGCMIPRFWRELLRDARISVPAAITALRAPVPALFGLLSLIFLSLNAMNWVTPPRLGDALQGYMFSARWLYRHGFEFSPYNTEYILFPLNTEAVFALSYAFNTDLVAKSLDGLLAAFFVFGVYEFARRYTGRPQAFLASASLAVMPGFATLAGGGKVDIASSYILFQGLTILFAGDRARPAYGRLVLAAFLVGTACAQKYTHWMFAPVFLICVYYAWQRLPVAQTARAIALATLIITACLTPHFVKNTLWTGNPVAPFGRSIFPSEHVYLDHRQDNSVYISPSEMLLLPYSGFFDFHRHRWGGWLPPMLLVGLAWFAVVRPKKPDLHFFLGISILQVVIWMLVTGAYWMGIRFLLVPIALLLVVAAAGIERAWTHPFWRAGIIAAAVWLIAFEGLWSNRHHRHSWRFVLGQEDRAAWQERMAPGRAYNALRAAAPLIGPDSKIFLGRSHRLYNLPEDKLPFTNVERESLEFRSVPDDQKLTYLRAHGFRFYLAIGEDRPEWTDSLSVFYTSSNREGSYQFHLMQDGQPFSAAVDSRR